MVHTAERQANDMQVQGREMGEIGGSIGDGDGDGDGHEMCQPKRAQTGMAYATNVKFINTGHTRCVLTLEAPTNVWVGLTQALVQVAVFFFS